MASMAKGSKAKAKKVGRTSPSASRAAAGKPKRVRASAVKRATGKRAAAKKTRRTGKDAKSARPAKSGSRSAQTSQRQTPGKTRDVVAGKSAAGARRQPLSSEARKKLAGEHLRALLEEKKRRTAQTPAWRTIEHHDRAPRPPEPAPPDAVSGSDPDRGLDDQDESRSGGSAES